MIDHWHTFLNVHDVRQFQPCQIRDSDRNTCRYKMACSAGAAAHSLLSSLNSKDTFQNLLQISHKLVLKIKMGIKRLFMSGHFNPAQILFY